MGDLHTLIKQKNKKCFINVKLFGENITYTDQATPTPNALSIVSIVRIFPENLKAGGGFSLAGGEQDHVSTIGHAWVDKNDLILAPVYKDTILSNSITYRVKRILTFDHEIYQLELAGDERAWF